MGMAGGAYKGDKERAEFALRVAQVANQNAQAQQNAALRQQELDQRSQEQADSNALANRRLDMMDEQTSFENDLKRERQNSDIEHQQTMDGIALRAAERAEADWQQKYARQGQVYQGYEQLAAQSRKQQEQRQALGQSAIASAMKLAMNSGGKDANGVRQKGAVPMYALQALNRDLGFDGQNQGIVAGGFTANNDFYLQFAQKDPQTGQMITTPQILTPMDQYRVMHQQQGIFDNNDRGTMAMQLKKSGFRDDEIILASGLNQTQLEALHKAASAKQTQNMNMKERFGQLSMIKTFLDGEEGQQLDEETKAALGTAYKNGIMQIASQFMPQQQAAANQSNNRPVVGTNGDTLTMPNGTTLRKNQEWTDPTDGKKYIWRGGNVRNFEPLGNANGEQPGKDNQNKVVPGYELENGEAQTQSKEPVAMRKPTQGEAPTQGEEASRTTDYGPRVRNEDVETKADDRESYDLGDLGTGKYRKAYGDALAESKDKRQKDFEDHPLSYLGNEFKESFKKDYESVRSAINAAKETPTYKNVSNALRLAVNNAKRNLGFDEEKPTQGEKPKERIKSETEYLDAIRKNQKSIHEPGKGYLHDINISDEEIASELKKRERHEVDPEVAERVRRRKAQEAKTKERNAFYDNHDGRTHGKTQEEKDAEFAQREPTIKPYNKEKYGLIREAYNVLQGLRHADLPPLRSRYSKSGSSEREKMEEEIHSLIEQMIDLSAERERSSGTKRIGAKDANDRTKYIQSNH